MAHHATLTLWERQLPPKTALPRVNAVPHKRLPRELILPEDIYINYGYINEEPYEKPDAYVRWMQPNEEELSRQVEYDMDEQDMYWLKAYNEERRKQGTLDAISEELFEIVMDRLEKEWFDLSSRIPKAPVDIRVEDSICEICNDGEAENSNAIVFCDGCNLAVHQDCYGVPYIPEGQWLCRKCTVSPHRPVNCVLCPVEAGAFKQTTSGAWAHLLCAIFVPEVGVQNTVYMEPIDGVDAIPRARWKLGCYLCRYKGIGAPIQCANKACFTAFHVTCAREYGLPLQFRRHNADGTEETDHKGWCHKHVPRHFVAEFEEEEPEEEAAATVASSIVTGKGQRTKKAPRRRDASPAPITLPRPKKAVRPGSSASRAHNRNFLSRGPPLVPQYIFDHVFEYTKKLWRKKGGKAVETLNQLCRYWSLKKEARRGASLLKRLHLEPWTANASRQFQSDLDREKKLDLMRHLRNDLGQVSDMLDKIREREGIKLQRAENLADILTAHLLPLNAHFFETLKQIEGWDKEAFFLAPVTRHEAPDYDKVVSRPMCLRQIRQNVEDAAYLDVQSFKKDVDQTFINAKLYNPPDHVVHKAAVRLMKRCEPAFAQLDNLNNSEQVEHRLEVLAMLTEEYILGLTTFNPRVPWTAPKIKPPKPVAMPSPKKGRPKGRKSRADAIAGDDETSTPQKKRPPANLEAASLDLNLILPSRSRRGLIEPPQVVKPKRKPKSTLTPAKNAEPIKTAQSVLNISSDSELSDLASNVAAEEAQSSDLSEIEEPAVPAESEGRTIQSLRSSLRQTPARTAAGRQASTFDEKRDVLNDAQNKPTPHLKRTGPSGEIELENEVPPAPASPSSKIQNRKRRVGEALLTISNEAAQTPTGSSSPPKEDKQKNRKSASAFSPFVPRHTRGIKAKLQEIGFAPSEDDYDGDVSVIIPEAENQPNQAKALPNGTRSAETSKKSEGAKAEDVDKSIATRRPKRASTSQAKVNADAEEALPDAEESAAQMKSRKRARASETHQADDDGEPPAKRRRQSASKAKKQKPTAASNVTADKDEAMPDATAEPGDLDENVIIQAAIVQAAEKVPELRPYTDDQDVKIRVKELLNENRFSIDYEICDGEQVWVKVGGYPWWPAEVDLAECPNPEDINDPDKISKAQIRVMFFTPSMAKGASRQIATVTRDKLRKLGNSKEFDDLMVTQQPEWTKGKPKVTLMREIAISLQIARSLVDVDNAE